MTCTLEYQFHFMRANFFLSVMFYFCQIVFHHEMKLLTYVYIIILNCPSLHSSVTPFKSPLKPSMLEMEI